MKVEYLAVTWKQFLNKNIENSRNGIDRKTKTCLPAGISHYIWALIYNEKSRLGFTFLTFDQCHFAYFQYFYFKIDSTWPLGTLLSLFMSRIARNCLQLKNPRKTSNTPPRNRFKITAFKCNCWILQHYVFIQWQLCIRKIYKFQKTRLRLFFICISL